MLRRPELDEILELAKGLGFNLTPIEARIFQPRMMEQIGAFEAFNELRIEEQRLPLKYTNRDPGYRPTEEEDPLNAFIRKCHVQGAEEGPLKGKRIGLKDHISVAGVPLSFGSHFMDGYIPDFDATIVTRLLDSGGPSWGSSTCGSSRGEGLGWAVSVTTAVP